jgi:hypothetical protein
MHFESYAQSLLAAGQHDQLKPIRRRKMALAGPEKMDPSVVEFLFRVESFLNENEMMFIQRLSSINRCHSLPHLFSF